MKPGTSQLVSRIILGVLIAISFTNLFQKSAIEFEEKAAKEIAESILILEEIESLSIPLAENIPFLKTWANTYEKDFDKLLSYLNISYLLLLVQFTLLKLSHWWLFKAALVLFFIGLFIPAYRGISFKLLVLGLIISPGLSIYTQFMSAASQQLKLDTGNELKTYLSNTRDSVMVKKTANLAKLDSLESKQRARHDGKLNIFNKVEDEVIKLSIDVKSEVEKLGGEFLDILRYASNHSLGLAVALLSNILILFFVLPILFWYLFSLWLKRLFGYDRAYDEIHSKLDELKGIVKSDSKTT